MDYEYPRHWWLVIRHFIMAIALTSFTSGRICCQFKSLNHMMTPGAIQTDGGELPGAAAIASLLDAAIAVNKICRAQNHMVGISWVQPGGAAIAVPVEVLPGRPAVG